MNLFNNLKKKVIVSKIRKQAQKLKGAQTEEVKIDKQVLADLQEVIVQCSNMLKMVNFDAIINQAELHFVQQSSTTRGAKGVVDATKKARETVKEFMPIVESLLGDAVGVLDNEEGIKVLITEIKRSIGAIMDQAATLYSESDTKKMNMTDLIEKHIKNLQEEEKKEEEKKKRRREEEEEEKKKKGVSFK